MTTTATLRRAECRFGLTLPSGYWDGVTMYIDPCDPELVHIRKVPDGPSVVEDVIVMLRHESVHSALLLLGEHRASERLDSPVARWKDGL